MATEKLVTSYLDGDGQIVSYPNPFGEVTPEILADAEQLEAKIIEAKAGINREFIKLAYFLDLFDENKLYFARGYETFRAWVSSPEVDLSYRVANDMMRIRRELVPVLEAASTPKETSVSLIEVGSSKARAILPLLREEGGDEKAVDLMERASAMTWEDVRAEVKKIRSGEEEDINKPAPATFVAKIKQGETHSALTISVTTGVDTYTAGKLLIRNDHLPRFESRFGSAVTFEKE